MPAEAARSDAPSSRVADQSAWLLGPAMSPKSPANADVRSRVPDIVPDDDASDPEEDEAPARFPPELASAYPKLPTVAAWVAEAVLSPLTVPCAVWRISVVESLPTATAEPVVTAALPAAAGCGGSSRAPSPWDIIESSARITAWASMA